MQEVADLGLPLTKDLTRDLLAEFIEKNGEFDVDKFLLENNFQYVSLDELTQEVSALKQEMNTMMLDEITDSFPDYSNICEKFNSEDNNEILNKLKNVLQDAEHFKKQLHQLIDVNVRHSRENVTVVLSYLKSLDNLLEKLDTLIRIHESLDVSEQLLASLESMITLEQDNALTLTLATQLTEYLVQCDHEFRSLCDKDSPLIFRLRNQFKGILEASKPLVVPILQKKGEEISN